MTTYLGKSCSFGLPRVPFVNCGHFMYLVISLLVLRAGCGIWLYQFLIIAYLFTFSISFVFVTISIIRILKHFLFGHRINVLNQYQFGLKWFEFALDISFVIHRNANGFDRLHQTQNHEEKIMSDDVTKERHLKCHFSLFYHFFCYNDPS